MYRARAIPRRPPTLEILSGCFSHFPMHGVLFLWAHCLKCLLLFRSQRREIVQNDHAGLARGEGSQHTRSSITEFKTEKCLSEVTVNVQLECIHNSKMAFFCFKFTIIAILLLSQGLSWCCQLYCSAGTEWSWWLHMGLPEVEPDPLEEKALYIWTPK